MRDQKGQTTFEYAVLITVVIAAILSIMIFAKRAVEGRFRASAEAIGPQWSAKETDETTTILNEGVRKEDTFQSGKSSSVIVAGASVGGRSGGKSIPIEKTERTPTDAKETIPAFGATEL